MPNISYPYKQSVSLAISLPIIFGCTAWFFITLALSEVPHISIFRAIKLSTSQTIVVSWIAAALSIFVASMGLLLLINHFSSTKLVTLTEKALILPQLFSRTPRSIPYVEITSLHLREIKSQHSSVKNSVLIEAITSRGKIRIASSMLPSKEAALEIYKYLMAKTNG